MDAVALGEVIFEICFRSRRSTIEAGCSATRKIELRNPPRNTVDVHDALYLRPRSI
jgi:hypothetical protein